MRADLLNRLKERAWLRPSEAGSDQAPLLSSAAGETVGEMALSSTNVVVQLAVD